MLVVAFLCLFLRELPLQLVYGHIDALVGIRPRLRRDEHIAVLASGNDLDTHSSPVAPVDNDLDPIDAIVIPRKLRRLFLRMGLHRFRDIEVFSRDCK